MADCLRRRRERGQSLVELTFLIPVVLLLFMGVYTAGSFVSDMDVAGQAVRAGARLGAEVGNYNYPAPQLQPCMASVATDPCAVDQDIVTSTVTVARDMKNVKSLDEIDIYQPCAISGSCPGNNPTADQKVCSPTGTIPAGNYAAGDPVDVYKLSGGVWTLTQPNGATKYSLDLRKQTHPLETAIGVRLVFTFQAAAPFTFFNIQTSQFTAMCLAPIESGG